MLLSRLKLSASFAYQLRGQAQFLFLDPEQIKRAQERRVRTRTEAGKVREVIVSRMTENE